MRLRHNLRRTAAIVGLLAAAACVPAKGRQRAILIFTNDSLDQATVYATILGGNAVRIGTVMGLHTDTLTVPSTVTDQSGPTTIVARLLARSYQPSTGYLTLRAEDVFHIRLSSDGRSLFVAP